MSAHSGFEAVGEARGESKIYVEPFSLHSCVPSMLLLFPTLGWKIFNDMKKNCFEF